MLRFFRPDKNANPFFHPQTLIQTPARLFSLRPARVCQDLRWQLTILCFCAALWIRHTVDVKIISDFMANENVYFVVYACKTGELIRSGWHRNTRIAWSPDERLEKISLCNDADSFIISVLSTNNLHYVTTFFRCDPVRVRPS